LRQDEPAGEGAGEPKRHVDPKHRAPTERLEQDTAERRTDRKTDSLRRALNAEGTAALGWTNCVHDDGDAVRREETCADRFQDSEGDKERDTGRKAAQTGAEHE